MTSLDPDKPSREDYQFQDSILQGVSRTFALTIPRLPDPLRIVVGNAYLLCRIADTIEDEPELETSMKRQFSGTFVAVAQGNESAESFATGLLQYLSATTSSDERLLIENTPRVIRITRSFSDPEARSLCRCVQIMTDGMVEFQQNASLAGLDRIADLDRYCYHVAGVVGEMLTELFCHHSTQINENRKQMLALAVSFGQGLQMTNILMDIWDDRKRDMCWLPREVFESLGVNLPGIDPKSQDPQFAKGILQLTGLTIKHLENALRYTLLIPARETGIREHCLMALAMAVLTLRRIHSNPQFTDRNEVKISRRSVLAVAFLSRALARRDKLLKLLFSIYARRLIGPQ